jgi:hypothetical protein
MVIVPVVPAQVAEGAAVAVGAANSIVCMLIVVVDAH